MVRRGSTSAENSVTRTVRMDAEWDRALQEEADRQGISVSALYKQIMRRYALSQRWLDRFQAIVVTSRTFSQMMEALPEELCVKLGMATGASMPRDGLLMMGRPMDFDSIYFLIEELLGRYGNWFSSEHHVNAKEEVFHLRHDLGKNWSLFLGGYVTSMFRTILDIDVGTDVGEGFVTIHIDNGNLPTSRKRYGLDSVSTA